MEESTMGTVRVDWHRCSLSRHKKLATATASLALTLATVVLIVVSLSARSNNVDSFANISNSIDGAFKTEVDPNESNITNPSDGATQTKINPSESTKSYPSDGAAKTKIDTTKSKESNITITPFSGNISDFIVANREVVRKSSFSAIDCPIGEGLWNLMLKTDNYPWETKWELHGDNSAGNGAVASGPPEGSNYERRTRYTGNLCLPNGQYYIRWFDAMEDGICCEYGQGEWTVRVNGKVVLENIPERDSNSKQKDFPFQVTTSAGGMMGTFLMPRANVELPGGAIFELINLPTDFDRADSGLVSGITSIMLPVGTQLFSNATADMKGEAPRVLGNRFLQGHRKDPIETTASSLMKRKQKRGCNLRASFRHRQLAKFKGDQTVLVVRVISADGTTSADENALSNNIFGNGVDPHNLVSQFRACSYGKLNLIKADFPYGILTVRVPSVRTSQGDGTMRNVITNELNEMFGVDSPSRLADYVIYCLPPGTFTNGTGFSTIAYAFYNSWLSVFHDDWCMSLSLQMHEIGHSMNFGHSNEGGRYGDETGFMGYSYPNKDSPRKCFNAAKSWQSGWYRDKGITVNFSGATTCFAGILYGVADYPIATTVLLKIQNGSDNDYYVNFNSKKGINRGTNEGGNQVTVVSRPRGPRNSFAESELVAKLGSGGTYTFSGYKISVGEIDIDEGTAKVEVLTTGQDDCSIR